MLLRPRSGGVQPNFGEAQDREEVGPCNYIQQGTFLEDTKIFKVIGQKGVQAAKK